ncbi:bifunctional 3,4-dihydroxy-2-butanone-4-phosphate synthase/GTP cyclohydrolase II [Phaeacidiphilus oryzae]|uniref:bifunctional 3,4-dihydroxy-2-butanone-4-phosphate synthase/GTP cyclohydrolase II n=1 Tax=Phaeacidiphilus oryzae TaxID=348818 RepID=UPI0005696E1C|nr:bifunctional 3,4-dihydroxy-2-butanone-4-phosphate synthase/GTP cyclohydrolase II [Phaeacidiphilus oryzae]
MTDTQASAAAEGDEPYRLDTIERAVKEIAAGRPVIVVDDADRENEGDLVFAAELATPELVALMMTECRGLICVPVRGEDADRMELPQMVAENTESMRTAFTVSVDAAEGVTTGISAADRAHTIRLLASGDTRPRDLVRPGHVFPLRAREGGVLVRPGHTEAGVDLARMAGLSPAAAICEIANPDGTMARLPRLLEIAREQDLAIVSIADLIAHRRRTENTVERVATVHLPTEYGTFTAIGYRDTADGGEHLALVAGGLDAEGRLLGRSGAESAESPLVRLHSECLTGDVLGSQRCDCGPQLHAALERIAEEGGVLVYLRGHEGRGIGLLQKLQAYQLQEEGRDTVDANLDLGLPADARDYGTGAAVLADLGIDSVRLLTNNPDKVSALERYGLAVAGREPVPVQAGEHNLRYLLTKRDRMGHDLPWLDALGAGGAA